MTQNIQSLLQEALDYLDKQNPKVGMAKYRVNQALQEIKEQTKFKQSDSKVEQFPLEVH